MSSSVFDDSDDAGCVFAMLLLLFICCVKYDDVSLSERRCSFFFFFLPYQFSDKTSSCDSKNDVNFTIPIIPSNVDDMTLNTPWEKFLGTR